MRIKSTYPALAFLPPLFVAYAWTVYYQVHIAGPIGVLFFLGATLMIIYASTLAYIVDANPGRSSSAVACNSLFRGALAVRLNSSVLHYTADGDGIAVRRFASCRTHHGARWPRSFLFGCARRFLHCLTASLTKP